MQFPLTITANPVLTGPTYAETIWRPLDWHHRIAARGGFISAAFSLTGPQWYIEEWFASGLDRAVRRTDELGRPIWEGYVHSLTLSTPQAQAGVSLELLANKVYCYYLPADFSVNPPTLSAAALTAAQQDTASQTRHGVAEYVVKPTSPLDEMTVTQANARALDYLTAHRRPPRSPSLQSGDQLSLQVECRGWGDWYRRRYYTAATTGTANANVVVAAVNTSVGQFVASTALEVNTLATEQQFDAVDLQTAWDILEAIADRGDGTSRWNWGVKEGRVLYFRVAVQQVDYTRRNAGGRQEVATPAGVLVHPWQLRPDKFLRVLDMPYRLGDRSATYALDPSIVYLEAVEWDEADPFAYYAETVSGDALGALLTAASA